MRRASISCVAPLRSFTARDTRSATSTSP
jgi:hypothetical protein